ncbi:hypothetical protein [Rhodococcus tukisamuensis]|uniref:Uncharacterized protein n=1 Tax=Rhodococcus tukisamuensis TaxID=168276 RepID=A0A1G6ZRY3_9NOCA|nr:hypothetical protein [Rhodococcus tukisamuensis]SDE05448.1 hypothetical protein SAMN05444580_109117 [Rhodococcus tukisamuensis]
MAGKGIDRTKAQTALEVVRESPAITAIVVAPAVVVFGLLWWLTGFGTALLVTVLLGVVVVAGKKFLG